jgi:serine protease Do
LLVGTILINRLETPNDALTVAEVSDLVNPGTVLIYASSDVGSSYGTGFFVRTDGCIVTNCHIVKDAKKITVTLYTGEELEAETLWFSSVDDLAVIKVNGSGFPVLKIGNSDEVKVGDTAIAIGNPAGNLYPWTTTQGIISAVDREVTVEGLRSIADLTMLQTDAQVNPGNSGGPLCNDRGEVIGIVARKKTDYEGFGLAIPINGAMELVNAYLNTGSSSGVISSISKVRPTIGIQAAAVKMGDPITDDFSAPCDCILVVSVTEGGSADGVLQAGDLILSANGRQVTDMNDLKAILYACRMGDTLRLHVNRFGTVMDLTVKFGSAAG